MITFQNLAGCAGLLGLFFACYALVVMRQREKRYQAWLNRLQPGDLALFCDEFKKRAHVKVKERIEGYWIVYEQGNPAETFLANPYDLYPPEE